MREQGYVSGEERASAAVLTSHSGFMSPQKSLGCGIGLAAFMAADAQLANALRGDIVNVVTGTFFMVVGLMSIAIAAIRRRGGVRVLIWLGIWSGFFGANEFANASVLSSAAALPHWFEVVRSLVSITTKYLTIVAAGLAFMELTLGALRQYLKALLVVDVAIASVGIGAFFVTGSEDTLLIPNQIMAVAALLALIVVLLVPSWSHRFMAFSGHRALIFGSLVFGAEALYANIARTVGRDIPDILNSAGFAVLLFSLGYVALEMIRSNERRLLAIDSELAIARELQFSILPSGPPDITGLRIAATYEPMTAVAGDFYEFLPVDDHRTGFLVADVSGHGVPAALIASMIKVAAQSVNGSASDPAEVLRRLGGILSSHLRGQFVSAAYLWIDTEGRCARYSAAGHPPLLRWSAADSTLTRIESNGLLFGVRRDCEYPNRNIPLAPGDRFFLYTDGVTEPENAAGEQFGDHKLGEVIRANRQLPAPELSERILSELRSWQPAAQSRQDDITLVVVDVLAN
jgi:phosphoserine phosphatase RsbU/P